MSDFSFFHFGLFLLLYGGWNASCFITSSWFIHPPLFLIVDFDLFLRCKEMADERIQGGNLLKKYSWHESWALSFSSLYFLHLSEVYIKKGQPGATKLPLCAGSKEGLDHLGLLYAALPCFARGCFYDSNPWPPGHTATTLPLRQGSPFLRSLYAGKKCK